MSNASLLRRLRKLVDQHGSAQVSVWLDYKDSRSIGVWLSSGKIPRARIERVRSVVETRLK